MVATDVASRGIGMIDQHVAPPVPMPSLRCVFQSMRSPAFCERVLCIYHLHLVRACQKVIWHVSQESLSILCNVARHISHSASLVPSGYLGGLRFS